MPNSPGDYWLNEDNPIVNLDGTYPAISCNGDDVGGIRNIPELDSHIAISCR